MRPPSFQITAVGATLLAALSVATSTVATAAAPASEEVKLTSALATVPSGKYVVEPHHTRVTWQVSHHGFSAFQALLPQISGTLQLDSANIERSRVEITIDMAAAISGIAEFDQRMGDPEWQIFSSRTFPTATFRSTSVQRQDARRFRVNGELTFLGVTRPITLQATFNLAGTGRGAPAGYRIGFDATAVMKRSDWGSTGMPTNSDAVQLTIETEFLRSE